MPGRGSIPIPNQPISMLCFLTQKVLYYEQQNFEGQNLILIERNVDLEANYRTLEEKYSELEVNYRTLEAKNVELEDNCKTLKDQLEKLIINTPTTTTQAPTHDVTTTDVVGGIDENPTHQQNVKAPTTFRRVWLQMGRSDVTAGYLVNKNQPGPSSSSSKLRSPQSNGNNEGKKEALEKLLKLQLEVDGRKPPEVWNKVLFFPEPQPRITNYIDDFLNFFRGAKISIHICVYLLSYFPLEKVILEKFDQGLNIKVITDRDTMAEHNNNAKRLRNIGITVLTKRIEGLMHNKFAIIDNEAIVTGSLNWTKQGITANNENVIATTDQRIVQKYVKEFARLWREYTEAERKESEDGMDVSP